jgi:hypothetical protein
VAGGKPDSIGAHRYDRVARNSARKVVASWEDADQETLWRTIQEVTNQGDAVMFSKTRDEGAVVLTVLSGDDRIRQYATGAEEIAELLRIVREAAQAD